MLCFTFNESYLGICNLWNITDHTVRDKGKNKDLTRL